MSRFVELLGKQPEESTMRRHSLSLQLESLESLTLLSGVASALTLPDQVGVRPSAIASAKNLSIPVSVSQSLALPARASMSGQSAQPTSHGLKLPIRAKVHVDTIAPTVAGIEGPAAKTFGTGDVLSFTVSFSEKVYVTGGASQVTLPVKIGDAARTAFWNGAGSGTKSLTFTTAVQAGDRAADGVSVAGPIGLSGGATIRDAARDDASLSVDGVPTRFTKATAYAAAPFLPSFSAPSVTSKRVSMQVTFGEAVTVKGKPSIAFTLGGVPRRLVYAGGSGTQTLTFAYKPHKGEVPTADSVVVPAQAITGGAITGRQGHAAVGHGFIGGAAGAKRFQQYAPTEVSSVDQLNQPLGQAKADKIARALGLDKSLCFTQEQYLAFISGNGKDGSGNLADAELVDESVAILTNSSAHPLVRNINGQPTQIVLGSYGLTVNTDGMLESPANTDAPTRQVNSVIAPGGYLSTWAAANGAQASLKMLYRSAYTVQLPYGTAAQHEGTDAELALYRNGANSAVTGLSMASSIWEINFALIYTLNPKLAAEMPAYWAPIPGNVVAALEKSPTGQVPFSVYASSFNDLQPHST
ncbi:MAG: hypothetical protein P4L84_08945 [Isosphaeraceae bacterium]|nr:hypothetical protein [Isosphaeraceae bacterium]